ncbi:SusC/RagA family TonB-linked outer membrane protein [Pedobacter sp. ok626]|uniref:SusC/RagA family TonB-linked outer membrane protein n=1 Tax=Pedobacter sp. ok626 TaxID=1761882 RepID=UPI001404A4F6|nr:SusC/RagA family TonB-linked outer membrane protein [Pedobacter sp. ok626]
MIRKILSFIMALTVSGTALAQVNNKLPVKVIKSLDSPLVHIGYNAIPGKYISGSVSPVSATQLKNLLPQNIKSVLAGQVSGLHIVQANGMPGSTVSARIRGNSSIFADSEPLYVIDGVPVYSGPREVSEQGAGGNWGAQFDPLSDFNIDDVASLVVLKDAASTAIYGARGGNGVILITTKKGEKNKSDINFNFYQGVTDLTKRINSLNGAQYLQLLDESWVNGGGTGNGPLPVRPGFDRALAQATDNDNLDELLNMGNVQQLSLTSSYGSDKTNFYLSGAYRNEEGVLNGNDLTRYSTRLKVTNQITKRLNIGVNMGMYYSNHSTMPVGRSVGGGFNAAQSNLPVFPYLNPDGSLFSAINPNTFNVPGNNVNAFQSKEYFNNEEQTSRYFLSANFTYNINRDLILNTDASLERYYIKRSNYLAKVVRNGSIGSGTGREGFPTAYAGYEKYSNNLYNGHSTLNYKKSIGKHKIIALAGVEYNYSENPIFFAEGEGFGNDFTREPSTANYKNQKTPLALVANTAAFLGFFANANYVFKDKYLAGATIRTDGSSRFGANNKYVTSPAVSVGWLLSEEDFLKKSAVINSLKLRVSYGQSGNSGIGNYASLERWNINLDSRYLLQTGLHMQSLGTADLKPERLTQFDVGIDYTILNKRISGTIDFYNKVTNDLILAYNAPLSAGVVESALLINAGSMRNRGLEVSISSKNLVGRNLKWTSDLVVTSNSNKILNLGGLTAAQLSYHKNIITQVGSAVGTYYLAEYAGVDPSTGQELIYNLAGEKVAATSASQIDDARVAQSDKPSAPKFFGGLNNTLSYKRFDLGVLMTFSYGNYVLDEGERDLSYLRGENNLREAAIGRWTPQNTNADYPRLVYNDPVAGSNTTRFLHDASYLRMKNITLGYSFKNDLKKVKFIKNARLFVSAQNLFTITKFKGWDPEVAGNYSASLDRNLYQGITYMDLPQVRTFAAGFNLNF